MMQIWITKLLHDKKEGEFWITELLQNLKLSVQITILLHVSGLYGKSTNKISKRGKFQFECSNRSMFEITELLHIKTKLYFYELQWITKVLHKFEHFM